MFKKITDWYKAQSSTTKGMILLGIVLIIGILIRWDYIVEHIKQGFEFYSIKNK